MWKRAFIVLVSINLVIFAAGIAWLNSFPNASPPPSTGVSLAEKAANVQLVIGPDAINTYLEYALSEQADLKQIFSYARVQFSDTWDGDIGIKLTHHVIPFSMSFQPTVESGNLRLQIKSAAIGSIPVPTSLVMLVLKHAPWPYWISLDIPNEALVMNFTKRIPHPYGIQILDYTPLSKQLTLSVRIAPKTVKP